MELLYSVLCAFLRFKAGHPQACLAGAIHSELSQHPSTVSSDKQAAARNLSGVCLRHNGRRSSIQRLLSGRRQPGAEEARRRPREAAPAKQAPDKDEAF